MDEHISAIILPNKTKTLCVVKPLHDTLCHFFLHAPYGNFFFAQVVITQRIKTDSLSEYCDRRYCNYEIRDNRPRLEIFVQNPVNVHDDDYQRCLREKVWLLKRRAKQ